MKADGLEPAKVEHVHPADEDHAGLEHRTHLLDRPRPSGVLLLAHREIGNPTLHAEEWTKSGAPGQTRVEPEVFVVVEPELADEVEEETAACEEEEPDQEEDEEEPAPGEEVINDRADGIEDAIEEVDDALEHIPENVEHGGFPSAMRLSPITAPGRDLARYRWRRLGGSAASIPDRRR